VKTELILLGIIAVIGILFFNAVIETGSLSDVIIKTIPSGFEGEIETKIHLLVNKIRVEAGLRPLLLDLRLADIARLHSQDMAQRNYFDHESPDGKKFGDRYREAVYVCRVYTVDIIFSGGENLARIQHQVLIPFLNSDAFAQQVVEGWLESEGHKDNVLRPEFLREGIGVVLTRDKIIATQNFC